MGIGQVLSELLSKKNTNAKALADEIGVTPSTIYSIIKRDNSKVDIDILIKICNALDVSVEYFYKLYEDEEARDKEANEKEPTMKEVSDRLRSIRISKGIKVAEIAEYLGITDRAYRFYEKGESEPNIAGLKKLADYFGCTVDYLVRGEAPGTIPEAARDHIMQRFCNAV